MAWEYADLFDVEVKPGSEWDLNDYLRAGDQPTSVRIGCMGYRTRTTVSGPRLEAEVFPIFGRAKETELRRARMNQTRESQQKVNMRRAKEHLIRMIEANFGENDLHLTLTYAGEAPEYARCRKDVNNFLRRIGRLRAKRGLSKLKYIYAIGHDEGQRIHAHVILNGGIGRDELEANWKKGRTNASRLQPDTETGLQGIANYLYKQNEKEKALGRRAGSRMWAGSRNLKKPKSRSSDSKCSNARVKRLALDFPNSAKEILEKLYPGYDYVSCQVFFSDIVDGAYIRSIMRKRKGVRQ